MYFIKSEILIQGNKGEWAFQTFVLFFIYPCSNTALDLNLKSELI